MEIRCDYCGSPAVPGRPDPPMCAHCWDRYEETQRRWEKVQQSGVIWNASKDDLFCRDWLTSRELFATYHDIVPQHAELIHRVLGGDVYEYGRKDPPNFRCRVQVWVSSSEVIVAYAPFGEQHGFPSDEEGIREFEGWVHHLRHSEPLELGRVRGRSSYGASCGNAPTAEPAIKWAQFGDWAGLARSFYYSGAATW